MSATTETAPILYIAYDEISFWGSGLTENEAREAARAELLNGVSAEEAEDALEAIHVERAQLFEELDSDIEGRARIIFIGDITVGDHAYTYAVRA